MTLEITIPIFTTLQSMDPRLAAAILFAMSGTIIGWVGAETHLPEILVFGVILLFIALGFTIMFMVDDVISTTQSMWGMTPFQLPNITIPVSIKVT